jgi:DNA-binding NarL/FixJ family response regulator
MRIVGEASDGQQATELHERLRPDVTLMDLQMPGVQGQAAIAAIRAASPAARILVLTTYPGDARAAEAIRAGASGYMQKSAMRRSLVEAIRAVHDGKTWMDPTLPFAGTPATRGEQATTSAALTAREIDVLDHVAQGRSNREVGELLSISEDAVKARLKSILAKLSAKDRTHAVTIARRRGLLVR